MRCFVAVVPPDDALAPLVDRVAHARDQWPQLGWVRPDRWHVTLAFLGEVDDAVIARLDAPLAAAAAQHRPSTLRVDGVGTFPATGRPRVVWAGLTGDVAELTALADDVAAAVRHATTHRDTKPFRAHITLARARREPVDDPAPLLATLAGDPGPSFTASGVVLFRSVLGPAPQYDVLARYQL